MPSLVPEQVHAEAGKALDGVGKVAVAGVHVLLPQVLGGHRLDQLHEVLVREHAEADGVDAAVQAEDRRTPGGQVQVAGPAVLHELQEAVDAVAHDFAPLLPSSSRSTPARKSGSQKGSKVTCFSARVHAVSALMRSAS